MPDLNLGTQRGFGQVGAVVQLLGDPEIADLDVLVLVEQNVLGFDVTVQDFLIEEVGQRPRDLHQTLHDELLRQGLRALLVEPNQLRKVA